MAGPEPLSPAAIAPLAIAELQILRASSSPVAAATAIPLADMAPRVEPLESEARARSKSLCCSAKGSGRTSSCLGPLSTMRTVRSASASPSSRMESRELRLGSTSFHPGEMAAQQSSMLPVIVQSALR